MLYLDVHESLEMELLLAQVMPTERTNLNPERPDIFFLGYGGKSIGLENKQANEILGSLDSTEEQLGREMQEVDYLALTVRGVITATPEGFCQVWERSKQNPNIMFRGREFKQTYVGYAAWKARLWELGVPVVEVPDLASLVLTITAMYKGAQKPEAEHRTFERLLPTHYWITEADQQKRNLALSLMGIRPSWGGGEERSLALAEQFPNIATLVNTLEAGADAAVAKVPLRNGKSTVGPAAVAKLKRSLGL